MIIIIIIKAEATKKGLLMSFFSTDAKMEIMFPRKQTENGSVSGRVGYMISHVTFRSCGISGVIKQINHNIWEYFV